MNVNSVVVLMDVLDVIAYQSDNVEMLVVVLNEKIKEKG